MHLCENVAFLYVEGELLYELCTQSGMLCLEVMYGDQIQALQGPVTAEAGHCNLLYTVYVQ